MERDSTKCLTHPNYIAAKQRSLKTNTEKALQRQENYLRKPTTCLFCSTSFSYENRKKKFCNQSCSAKHNNRLRLDESRQKQKQTLRQTLKTKSSSKQVNRSNLHVKETSEKILYTKVTLNRCIVCSRSFYRTEKRKTCSKDCYKANLSLIAKSKQLGGNKNNKAYGYYTSPYAGKVWLESSYELKVAQALDDNCIKWERPSYFNYVLEGKDKKYYPDFFLKDYNVYLDPKNDFLIIQDNDKINAVIEQNRIRVLVLNKHQLTWTYILTLLQN